MSQDPPPPYYEPMPLNIHGPQQYPNPPYMTSIPPNIHGPQQYPNPPYTTSMPQPIAVNTGTVPRQQLVTVYRSSNHCFCFLCCIFTCGLSIPCWIYECITEDL
jgi:hypothetical protein